MKFFYIYILIYICTAYSLRHKYNKLDVKGKEFMVGNLRVKRGWNRTEQNRETFLWSRILSKLRISWLPALYLSLLYFTIFYSIYSHLVALTKAQNLLPPTPNNLSLLPCYTKLYTYINIYICITSGTLVNRWNEHGIFGVKARSTL